MDYDFNGIAAMCYQITIIANQRLGDEYISRGDAAIKRGDAANTLHTATRRLGNSATMQKQNYDSFDYLKDYDFSSIAAICYQITIIANQRLGDEYISRGDAAIKRGDAANTLHTATRRLRNSATPQKPPSLPIKNQKNPYPKTI